MGVRSRPVGEVVQLAVRVPYEYQRALRIYSAEHNVSIEGQVREALADLFKKRGQRVNPGGAA